MDYSKIISIEEVDAFDKANDWEKDKTIPLKPKRNLQYSILQDISEISCTNTHHLMFRLMDWNGYTKYDLRYWKYKETPMKGITFSTDEMVKIKNINIPLSITEQDSPEHIYSSGSINASIYKTIITLSSFSIKNVLWEKKITLTDWGYGEKIDIRSWTSSYDKCSKGICVTKEDFFKLQKIIDSILPK